MNPVIQTEHLSKWYGPVIAINRVNMALMPGITALLGPNGAGKSTLMRLLTGHIRPSQGSVRLFGEDVDGNVDVLRRIGICPDFDNFYEDMTGLEFTTFFAKLAGLPTAVAKRAADETLTRLGLMDARKRRIRGYSKGMRQRVKLAQALVHAPDLIFLDEPMTGLDPVARHEVAEMLKDFARTGKSVLISSHILHEVESITENFVLLAHGQVLAEGDVHAIREELEHHPYMIRIVCTKPRELARALASDPIVRDIEIHDGDTESFVVLRTLAAGEVFSALPRLALDLGIEIFEIVSPDDNIEAVFDYLVKG